MPEKISEGDTDRAIERVLEEPGLRTPDMGGRVTTEELGRAVADAL